MIGLRPCRWLILIVALSAFSAAAVSQDAAPPLTFERLSCMSWHELQELYRNAAPGTLPCGFVRGRSLFNPCEALAGPRTRVANCLWKGKHFCPDDGTLVNQWLAVRAIRANIYPGDSWLDGKPAHILDYGDSSFIWRNARDEMRQVGPGLYVGAMFIRGCPAPHIKTMFILEACCVR